MKINNTLLAGGAGGLVGLLLGLAIGSSGGEDQAARARAQEELTAGVAALSQSVGAVESRLGAIDERVSGVEGSLAAFGETQSGHLQGLAQRLDEVGSSLGGAVSDASSEVSDALADELAGLRAQVAALADRAVARVEQATADAMPAAGTGEPVEVAHTVVFGDGGARVFLSAADRVRGTARVAVNGAELSTLALGQPATFGDCRLTLTGFVDNGATIEGACGAAAAAAAAVPVGSGEGTSIAVAGSAALADGKLRVFLSGTDAEAGTARVAINGTELLELKMSEPVEAGDCTVTLTGIAGGAATVDADC